MMHMQRCFQYVIPLKQGKHAFIFMPDELLCEGDMDLIIKSLELIAANVTLEKEPSHAHPTA